MPRKITRSKSSIGNINRLTVTCSEALRDEPSSEYFQCKFCRDSTELFFSSTVAAIKINARKTSSSRTFDPESTYTKTYRHVSPSSSVKNLVSKNGHTNYLPLLCSWQGSTRFKLFDRIRLTTTFHHQKTLSQHRENIRTTIHETRLVIGNSESHCARRAIFCARFFLSMFRNGHGHENFQRQVGELFLNDHIFPLAVAERKHSIRTRCLLAANWQRGTMLVGRSRPNAHENGRTVHKYYVRRPIDGRGAIDISMLLLILSVGGQTDEN